MGVRGSSTVTLDHRRAARLSRWILGVAAGVVLAVLTGGQAQAAPIVDHSVTVVAQPERPYCIIWS
jgi:hypothetical protein